MVLTIIYFKRASRGEVAEIFSMLFHTINRPTGSVDVRACFFFCVRNPNIRDRPIPIHRDTHKSFFIRQRGKKTTINSLSLSRSRHAFLWCIVSMAVGGVIPRRRPNWSRSCCCRVSSTIAQSAIAVSAIRSQLCFPVAEQKKRKNGLKSHTGPDFFFPPCIKKFQLEVFAFVL